MLLYASSASFIAHPYTQEKVPYDMERDLAPIARVSDTVLSAAVPAESGYKTLREFVEGAKKAPDKHNFAGAAGLPEFAAMAFVKSENLGISKIPYKDVMQGGRDLGENRIQFLVSSYAAVQPLIEAGKVRVVGRRRAHAAGAGRADRHRGRLSVAADRDHVGLLRAARHAARAAAADRPRCGRGDQRSGHLAADRGLRAGREDRRSGARWRRRSSSRPQRAAEIAKILGMTAKN